MPAGTVWHIGWHKTATTWLQQEAFARHPQIVAHLDASYVYLGDPLFEQLVAVPDHRYDPSVVRKVLDALPTGQGQQRLVTNERLSGHPFSGANDVLRIARRIVEADPEAKVVMVVREQGALVDSTYRQMVRMGWVGPPERLLDDLGWRTPSFHLSHFEFGAIVAAYRQVVADGHLKVLDYERFRQEPRAFLEELAAFIEVEPWQFSDAQLAAVVNRSRSPRQIRTQRRLNRFRRSEAMPFPAFELPDRAISAAIKAAGRAGRGAPLFGPDLLATIRERFVADNELLLELTGIDLRP